MRRNYARGFRENPKNHAATFHLWLTHIAREFQNEITPRAIYIYIGMDVLRTSSAAFKNNFSIHARMYMAHTFSNSLFATFEILNHDLVRVCSLRKNENVVFVRLRILIKTFSFAFFSKRKFVRRSFNLGSEVQ